MSTLLPKSQIGEPGREGVDFTGFLNKFLMPKLESSPELGLAALIPQLDTEEGITKTSAFTGLPELTPEVKSLFESTGDFYKKYMEDSSSLQKKLSDEFLAQLTRGEQPVNRSISQYALPLTADYQSRFGLPASRNASYSQIGTNVGQLNNYIK